MTYSFLNVHATLSGPGAVGLNLGAGSAVAEEGIDIEPTEDKNVMTIGADGQGQHSLIASDASKVTIRYLKTSPMNAILMALYDLQSASSALWGQNVITVTDSGRGDLNVSQTVAFKKKPVINYKKEAGLIEWEFDVVSQSSVLGFGQ
jgi:hypothetical protein